MPPEVAPGVVEHPELDAGPTAHPELDSSQVKSLAMRGFGTLLVRTIGQRGLQMAGNILLARWLAPETFGIYAIVSFVVGMAGFLSDLGLGASLIQRRERLTERDLRTAFSLSLMLNLVVVGTLWAVAGPLVRAYHLHTVNVLAVRMLAASILFSTFTTIPSIRLERELKFGRLSAADLSGQLVYVLIAVPLAFTFRHPNVSLARADDAVWCFVWATLASRAVHALVINVSSWWRPRLGLDRRAMRAMLAFGLPYQANGFVNAIKDNFVPTFIAFVAGAKSVGYVIWAVGMATNALFLLPIVSRVTFPAYARLQDDPPALKDAIEKSIKWVAATVFPTTLLLAALARQIVEHVYGPKWFPGLTSFYLLCIPMMNAAYSTVIVSALYGLGRARAVLRLTLIWAVAGWALGVPLTLWIGKDGFALGMFAVSWLAVLSVREMNKVVRVNFVRPLLRILVLSAIPAVVVASFARFVVHDSLQLVAVGALGVAGYLGLMFAAGELDDVRAMIRRARAPIAPARPPAPVAAEAVTDRA
ncbi:MAG: oligosaccharide flippase family protein [Actinomycetota bacterium]